MTPNRTFRLDAAALDILARWAERLGLTEADIVRLALRVFDKISLGPEQIATLAAEVRDRAVPTVQRK